MEQTAEVDVSQALASLVMVLDDDNIHSVCTGIQLSTGAFREALKALVNETNPMNAANLVNGLKVLKDKVLHILMSRKNHIGIQLRAIKFLEMLVLSFTPPDHGVPRKLGDTFCLADIPPTHPILSAPALARESIDYLSALIRQARDAGTCAGALATINCLCALVHQRSSLASTIVPALTQLSNPMPDFTPAQVTTFKHTLTNSLSSIARTPVGSGYAEMITACIESLGLGSTSRRQSKRSESRSEAPAVPSSPESNITAPVSAPSSPQSEPEMPTLPPPGYPPAAIPYPQAPTMFPLTAPAPQGPAPPYSAFPPSHTMGGFNQQAPPDMIATLLLDNMSHLPVTPPPPNQPLPFMDVQNLITFFAQLTQQVLQRQSMPPQGPAPVRLDPRRDPRLGQGPPTGIAPTGIPPIVEGPPPVFGAPPIVQPPFIPGAPMGQVPMATIQPEAATKPLAKQEPPKLRFPTLSESQLVTLNNLAFERILMSEDGVRVGGGSKLRKFLLIRLAVLRGIDDPCVKMLLNHIGDNFSNRHELAVSWLYQEYVNAKKRVARSKGKKQKLDDVRIKVEKMEDDTPEADTDLKEKIKEEREEEEGRDEADNEKQENGMNTEGAELDEEDIDMREGGNPMMRYDVLLQAVIGMLREKLDPADPLFTKLLLEAPELPPSALQMVKGYCEDESRVLLGLATLRDLILQRPPYSIQSLHILLTYTIHKVAFVRTAAINLVANTLFAEKPLLAPTIEEFAFATMQEMIESVQQRLAKSAENGEEDGNTKEEGLKGEKEKESEETTADKKQAMDLDQDGETKDDEMGQSTQSRKRKRGEEGKVLPGNDTNGTTTSTTGEEEDGEKEGEESEGDYARRHMLLCFALCAQKHALLDQLVQTYCLAPTVVKKEMHKLAAGLFKTVGMDSPYFLQLIAECPEGADTFILQALHILTDNGVPTAQLVTTVKGLYLKRKKDARFMIPILSGLHKDEVLNLLPRFINLPSTILKNVIHRLLHNKPTPLTPEELLVALHTLDPQKEKVPLRKVIEAIQHCFNQKAVYKQQIMAVVLQQLVDVLPIPPLFMRTVLQAFSLFPKMMSFLMGILSRLITKQVWHDKRLWKGFMKCLKVTQPHSFPVITQLPPQQIEDILKKMPSLKPSLMKFHEEHPSVNMGRALDALDRQSAPSATPATTSTTTTTTAEDKEREQD